MLTLAWPAVTRGRIFEYWDTGAVYLPPPRSLLFHLMVHLLHTLNRQYKQFSRGEMAHCHHFIGLTGLFLGLIFHLRLWTDQYQLWLFVSSSTFNNECWGRCPVSEVYSLHNNQSIPEYYSTCLGLTSWREFNCWYPPNRRRDKILQLESIHVIFWVCYDVMFVFVIISTLNWWVLWWIIMCSVLWLWYDGCGCNLWQMCVLAVIWLSYTSSACRGLAVVLYFTTMGIVEPTNITIYHGGCGYNLHIYQYKYQLTTVIPLCHFVCNVYLCNV